MVRTVMKSVKAGNRELIPSKVVCVGRNYTRHIEELGNERPEKMVIFNKPNSSLSDTLRYFGPDTRFECELCLLMENSSVAALGLGLDLTHAGIQNDLKSKGLPWERAKAFDGSAVMSEFIAIDNLSENILFELRLNGTVAQRGESSGMIYDITQIIEEIESFMTLEDGDIVMTGTPEGVGNYRRSDRFDATLTIDGRSVLECSWIAR